MKRDLVILASASPRRAELLAGLGLSLEILPVHLDETVLPRETAPAHVTRLAVAKAARAVAILAANARAPLVLGADTAVAVDGIILGKPADDDEALAMLRRLAGRAHDVLTGVHVVDAATGRAGTAVATSRVVFRPCRDDRLRWYVATGEPRDKAGAYGIQGLGVLLTDGLEGSWSNVVGLPLEILPDLFAQAGHDLWALLRP
jgi:septum formation protein